MSVRLFDVFRPSNLFTIAGVIFSVSIAVLVDAAVIAGREPDSSYHFTFKQYGTSLLCIVGCCIMCGQDPNALDTSNPFASEGGQATLPTKAGVVCGWAMQLLALLMALVSTFSSYVGEVHAERVLPALGYTAHLLLLSVSTAVLWVAKCKNSSLADVQGGLDDDDDVPVAEDVCY